MGFFDFLSGLFGGGGVPYRYRHIVSVFSSEVSMCDSVIVAQERLERIADRLAAGNEMERQASLGLRGFIARGGAKYFVRKK